MDIKKATGYGAGEWMAAGSVGAVVLIALIGLKACIGGNSEDKAAPVIRESVEIVRNSGWDGSVLQVKRFLKGNVKDPSSLEFIEWSPVRKTTDGRFLVRVRYRARNSFGGYVVENNVFLLSATGNVIYVSRAP